LDRIEDSGTGKDQAEQTSPEENDTLLRTYH